MPKKADIWANIIFLKTSDKVGSILPGLSFSFKSFLSFLCKGLTSASFKELRNTDDLNVALILLHKKSTKTSAFC